MLEHSKLLQLKRMNTPTIYNGWEQITAKKDIAREAINHEQVVDYMPQMGPMAGYAVTVKFQPGNPEHVKKNPQAWKQYREYVAGIEGPKIVVVEDLDKPGCFGAFWGEVNANMHRALGCVGTIIDGAVRDVDEMTNAGFKALARRMCVGHGWSCPVEWDCPVEVFGCTVRPGQLIHADKHGFITIEEDEEEKILEAARYMDQNECETMIPSARNTSGKTTGEILQRLNASCADFGQNAKQKFGRDGEW